MDQESTRHRAKHWFWLIGVPAIVLLIGLWQWERSQPAGAAEARLENSSCQCAAPSALQKSLPAAAVTLSALALLWAGLGLAYQRRLGRQAMRSRQQLLAAFLRGKRLLPVYTVVMAVLLFGAAIALAVHMNLHVVIGLLAFLLLKVLFDTIRVARRPLVDGPIPVMGQIVTREQAPRLWSFVGMVAQRIGASLPDAIVAGLDRGFFVTEHPVRLYSGADAPAGRVLYLPLPYMAFMSASEVAAVIGHELGHFMGEDTAYSQRFSPIYAAAIRYVAAVTGNDRVGGDGWISPLIRPVAAFGEMFLDSFREAVSFWSRKRELAADAVGAQAAGARAVATSLLRTAALEPRINEALTAQWDAGPDVSGSVLDQVRQLVAAKGMENPNEHLHNRQAHPFDTHPELAARLEALGIPVTDELLQCAMNPMASTFLQEMGLEAVMPPAQADEAADKAGAAAPAPAQDIHAALQTELTEAASLNRQDKIKALSAMAQAASAGELLVRERVWFLMFAVGFFALFLLIGGVSAIWPAVSGTGNTLLGLALLAAGTTLLTWCAWIFVRSRRPALLIRPDGLQLFDQNAALSWGAIDQFSVVSASFSVIVRLHLEPQAPAPTLGVLRRLHCRYSRERRLLKISLLLSDKRADQVVNAINTYWHAYHARMELQRMGIIEYK